MPLSTRLRRALPRLTRRRMIAGSVVVVLVAGLIGWAALAGPGRLDHLGRADHRAVRTRPAPSRWTWTPASTCPGTGPGRCRRCCWRTASAAPRTRSAADAESLAERGYAVLTWTARGFGRSGGQIHLDSPDYEVKDAQRLLDWLAARPEVRTDAAGDPAGRRGRRLVRRRAGAAAGRAGPAGGRDRPADHLERPGPLVPAAVGGRSTATGVFKKGWAGLFFGNGAAATWCCRSLTGGATDRRRSGDARRRRRIDPACGRFAADVCAAYLVDGDHRQRRTRPPWRCCAAPARPPCSTRSRRPRCSSRARWTRSSRCPRRTPTPAASRPPAPRCGSPGSPAGTTAAPGRRPIRTGPSSSPLQWLDHYVKGEGDAPADSFTYSRVAGFSALDRGLVTNGYSDPTYPGLTGTGRTGRRGQRAGRSRSPTRRTATRARCPRCPASAAGSATLLDGVAGDIPGQFATFDLDAGRRRPIDIVGAPTVRLRAASPTGEATLFVKLYDVDPDGAATLSAGLVAPVRLTGLPADIAAAPAGHRHAAGDRPADRGRTPPADRGRHLRPGVPHARWRRPIYTVAVESGGHRCPPWSASRSPTRR